MVDLEEGERERGSERWETEEGREAGRGEAGHVADRKAYGARSLELWEADEVLMVPEERGERRCSPARGRSREGCKRVIQPWRRRD